MLKVIWNCYEELRKNFFLKKRDRPADEVWLKCHFLLPNTGVEMRSWWVQNPLGACVNRKINK